MKVFNACIKVTKQHLLAIAIYLVIFSALALLFSQFGTDTQKTDFTETKINMAVINRDGDTSLTGGLKDYLAESVAFVALEDEKEALQDALFFAAADYILMIPEGFTEDFEKGGGMELSKAARPNTPAAYYGDLLIDSYLNTAALYQKAVPDLSEEALIDAVGRDASQRVEVEKKSYTESVPMDESFFAFYRMLPYVLMAMLILGVTTVMRVLNQPDLRKRNLCAPVKLRSINFQISLCNALIGAACWLVLVVISFFYYYSDIMKTDLRLTLLTLLNALVYVFVCLSVAFLCGIFIKNGSMQNAAANFISLALGFIGGVFVPLEFMGESVVAVARYTPAFWYVTALSRISELSRFTADSLWPVIFCMLIQLGFAAAIFSVALLISKMRRQSGRSFEQNTTEMA